MLAHPWLDQADAKDQDSHNVRPIAGTAMKNRKRAKNYEGNYETVQN